MWCTPIAGAYQIGAMFDNLSAKEASFLDMFMRYLDGSILPAGSEMEVITDDQPPTPGNDDAGRTPPPDVKDDPFKP